MSFFRDIAEFFVGRNTYRHMISDEVEMEPCQDDSIHNAKDVYVGTTESFQVGGEQRRYVVRYWTPTVSDDAAVLRFSVQRERFVGGAWEMVGGPTVSGTQNFASVGAVLIGDYSGDGIPDVSFEATDSSSNATHLRIPISE